MKARILMAAPPLRGHLAPLVAVANTLAAQGYAVQFLNFLDADLGLGPSVDERRHAAPIRYPSGEGDVMADALGCLGEFCREVYSYTLAQARAFAPDLVIADQQFPIASAVAADRGCPYIATLSTPALLMGGLPIPVQEATAELPQVGGAFRQALRRAYQDLLAGLGAELGAPLHGEPLSPHGNWCFATEAFCGVPAQSLREDRVRFVGPAIQPVPATTQDQALFDEVAAFAGRRFLLAMGSVLGNMSASRADVVAIYRNALLALDEPEHLLLMVASEDVTREVLEGVSPRATVLTRRFINQFHLMPAFDLLLTHGGYNTIAESLYHQVPVMAFPFVFDQSQMAHRLEDLGVGACVSRKRHTPALIRRCAEKLLSDAGLRERAGVQHRAIAEAGIDGRVAVREVVRLLRHGGANR
ncbi:glycosyltransferase [Tahibacter amnicola]|uniref:Glycosyltransferase n=1 Tax=Tahibacter amnicola TaxID=2976241 RepID=A0ABY6BMH3_9GAMM|nr:glycosyltransferase [Tahibacter amnicola]UXI69012.1 glycosyltransferase [Tahibacter amnicola]